MITGLRAIVIALCTALVVAMSTSTADAQTPAAEGVPPAGANDTEASPPKGGPLPGDVEEGPLVAVIPEHQEELFLDMLGRGVALPGGCTLSDGLINGPTARATYKCGAGEVVLELVHPDEAASGATTTDRFAINLKSGSAPDGLVTELASRIRAREREFQWKWLGTTPRKRVSRSVLWFIGGAAVVAIIAIIGLRRARRSR
jgi:hypothetical protein